MAILHASFHHWLAEASQETGGTAAKELYRIILVHSFLLMCRTTLAGPLLQRDGEQFNRHWGNLSRAGLNDKSQFTRQIEKYSDIYTSTSL